MEIKNGIIIDGVLHEAVQNNIKCPSCSLYEKCAEMYYASCMTDLFSCGGFVNRGKVTVTLSREVSKNVGEIIKNR